jgi:hypothetical protein
MSDPTGPLDLRELKTWVQRNLPEASELRQLVMGEPDTIPRSQLSKLEAYARLYVIEHRAGRHRT